MVNGAEATHQTTTPILLVPDGAAIDRPGVTWTAILPGPSPAAGARPSLQSQVACREGTPATANASTFPRVSHVVTRDEADGAGAERNGSKVQTHADPSLPAERGPLMPTPWSEQCILGKVSVWMYPEPQKSTSYITEFQHFHVSLCLRQTGEPPAR